MGEIHAKTIVANKFWIVEQDGAKIATLHKQENNKFLLSANDNKLWFNKKDEIVSLFGNSFFTPSIPAKMPAIQNECHGYTTKSKPYNAMYDVRRKLPLFTKSNQSKSLYCAGWYTVKFKNWVLLYCPKLITIDQYESHGPFFTKLEAKSFRCNLNK